MEQPANPQEPMPEMTDAEREAVQNFLNGYCEVILRIYERLEREQPGAIDAIIQVRRMKVKVDSSKDTN